jgi:hypothetical protein
MASDESRRFRRPRSFFAEQVAARESSQRIMEKQLESLRRQTRRRAAHEEASPMILESIDAMLVHTAEMRRESRTTNRLTWTIMVLALLTVALTTVLVVLALR